MNSGLNGKTALVTGASRGIGREIALSLARNDVHVAFNYHTNDKAADEVENEIKKYGGKVLKIKCPVEDYEATESLVKLVKEELGPIDILVNNAAILRDKFLFNMEAKDWIDVINTNLVGVFNVTKNVAFSMMRKRKGKIINMASLNAITGAPGQTNYAASKGGIISFTKSLAKELAPFGINVNAVAPGVIETDMLSAIPEDKLNLYLSYIPFGRFGKAKEVADTVLFLASDMSNYITGQTIQVDGGML